MSNNVMRAHRESTWIHSGPRQTDRQSVEEEHFQDDLNGMAQGSRDKAGGAHRKSGLFHVGTSMCVLVLFFLSTQIC